VFSSWQEQFLFLIANQGSTQPPNQWVCGVFFPWIKRPGREADNSPASNAEVTNAWRYTSTPQYTFASLRAGYVFMAWYIVKHRNNFAFLLFPYFLLSSSFYWIAHNLKRR
jgi:hypothetical protein